MKCMKYKEEELSKELNLSIQTLRSWRCKQKGPAYYKIGRTIYYSGKDVSDFINKNRIVPK